MKKIKKSKPRIFKIIKYFFFLILFWILVLFLSLYISSLRLYEEKDFDIPKDFFNTTYYLEDTLSSDNWFDDFITFINSIEENKNIDFINFSILWDCLPETRKNYLYKYYNSLYRISLKNINIYKLINRKTELNNLKDFVNKNEQIYKQINSKKFIIWHDEHSSVTKWLIAYTKALRYLVHNYHQSWNNNDWIKLLLEYQIFLNNLLSQLDWDMGLYMVIIKSYENNLESIEYFLDNYEVENELKIKIYNVLKQELSESILDDIIKKEHNNIQKQLDSFWQGIFIKNENQSYLKHYTFLIRVYLFFSYDETVLLFDKLKYDIIINKWIRSDLKISFNLRNFFWRTFNTPNLYFRYETYYNSFNELKIFRENILSKLD